MKKFTYIIIGFVLTLPLTISNALGISLEDFEGEVFRPENLPAGNVTEASAETKVLEILDFIIQLILYAAGSVAVLMLIIGAIVYIGSLGKQERMERGKKIITYAVIGLVIIILAFAVVTNVIDLIYRATV